MSLAPGFVVDLPEGKGQFVSNTQPASGGTPPMAECCIHAVGGQPCTVCTGDHTSTPESTMRYLMELWSRAREGKTSSHNKMEMLEKLYRGVHYEGIDANTLKRLEVTNFCFANVETVTGIFNKQKAMPRLNPTKALDSDQALKIREIANWWVNKSRASWTRSRANRSKVKRGQTVLLMTIDPATGFPFVNDWSWWDFYPDPSGKDISGCEYFIFAAPIPTRRLKQMFPSAASKIKSDNYVSPSWDVTKRIDQVLFQRQLSRNTTLPAITNTESTAPYKGNAQPTGSTTLSPSTGAAEQRGSETTFYFQIVVRDRTMQNFSTMGNRVAPDGTQAPDAYSYSRPACPSGWRVFYACPDGLLAQGPLDECYGGLNFAIDYYTRQDESIDGISEIEQIVPMNRAYNERKNMLNTGLRMSAIPVVRATKNSGFDFSKRTIGAGDVVEHTKGSEIEWMDYQGPGEAQFKHLEVQKLDMELVSGTNRTLSGVQPEGTRTGIQLKELQSAAAGRIQAKMPESLMTWAEIVLKALKIMRAKLAVPITFKATNGQMMTFTAADLDGEFTFDFPADETDLDSDEQAKNNAMTWFQLGLIDREEALKMMSVPGYLDIAKRMVLMDLQKVQVEAEAKAKAGGGKPAPKGEAA